MESNSVDLLGGLAAGAGGDVGRLAWTRLVELVRTPLPPGAERPGGEPGAIPPAAGSPRADGSPAPVPVGELESTLLGHETPGGLRAYTRAGAPALRAERDPAFARSIGRWYADARRIGTAGDGTADGGSGAGGGGRCRAGAGAGGYDVFVRGEGVAGRQGSDGPFRVGAVGPHPLPPPGASAAEGDGEGGPGEPGEPGEPGGSGDSGGEGGGRDGAW